MEANSKAITKNFVRFWKTLYKIFSQKYDVMQHENMSSVRARFLSSFSLFLGSCASPSMSAVETMTSISFLSYFLPLPEILETIQMIAAAGAGKTTAPQCRSIAFSLVDICGERKKYSLPSTSCCYFSSIFSFQIFIHLHTLGYTKPFFQNVKYSYDVSYCN